MASVAYAVNESATVIQIEQRRAEYMGSPQVNDGHTRIANELLEAILLYPFSGCQLKVVMAVIRKTYGFNKKADRVAQSVLAEMTGIAKPNICRALKQLEKLKVLTIDATGFAHKISLNKHYKEWVTSYQSDNSYQNDSYQNDTDLVITVIPNSLSIQQPQKKERQKTINIEIPQWIPLESWTGFVAMRKSIKKPITERGISLLITKLESLKNRGFDIASILDESTMNNWQGIFEPKNGQGESRKTQHQLNQEGIARSIGLIPRNGNPWESEKLITGEVV
jgi:phage replication O-like protein O